MVNYSRLAIFLALISSFSSAALAANPVWYGKKQEGFVGGRTGSVGTYVASDADWETQVNPNPKLRIIAVRDAVPKTINPSQSLVAGSAAILDFTVDNAAGVQVDYLGFSYEKLKKGLIFKDTTDPIVRVEYTIFGAPNELLYKTLPGKGTSTGYDRVELTKMGLAPEVTLIRRFAAVAKPKINPLVDDYAWMLVSNFRYHRYLNPDTDLRVPSASLQIRVDRNNPPLDALINLAKF